MQVSCPGCGHVLAVPKDKAAVPNLKAKCRCGTVFAIGAGPAAPAAVAPPASPTGARAPVHTTPRTPPAVPAAVLMATGAEALASPPLPARPPGVPRGAPLRTAAASPKLAPAAVVRPVAATSPERPRATPPTWRRCQNHAQARSEHVCPKCAKGFCDACTQKVQSAALCPSCEGLCVPAASYEQMQERTRQRARSMMEEIGVIAGYPLRDTIAFVLLALFTWFFGLFAGFAWIMVLLSKGVLTWYSFNAVSKVSVGNLRDVMPEFRDVSDIGNALRLSLAALVISAGPLFLCGIVMPGAALLTQRISVVEGPRLDVAHAQPPASPAEETEAEDDKDEAEPSPAAHSAARTASFDDERTPRGALAAPLAILAVALALLWMIGYMPVALTVAALSKSVLSTLNPLIGIDTIKKMGGTYWQALGIYAVIVAGQWAAGAALGLVPIAGGFVASFVNAYAALAIGCTLGMAVFKKAVELGWD